MPTTTSNSSSGFTGASSDFGAGRCIRASPTQCPLDPRQQTTAQGINWVHHPFLYNSHAKNGFYICNGRKKLMTHEKNIMKTTGNEKFNSIRIPVSMQKFYWNSTSHALHLHIVCGCTCRGRGRVDLLRQRLLWHTKSKMVPLWLFPEERLPTLERVYRVWRLEADSNTFSLCQIDFLD